MVPKKPFARTFIEAALPAWGMLIVLMFLNKGNLNGIAGLVALAAFAFPGIWGAIRLQRPEGSWPRRIGVYLLFCVAEGAGVAAVMLAALLVLQALGLYGGQVEASSLQGKLLLFGVVPGIVFLVLRGSAALPGAMRRWGVLGCLGRGAGLVAVLIILGAGAYWLTSRPYSGHAVLSEPKVLKAATIAGFGQETTGWKTNDPSVTLRAEDGVLKLTTAAPTLFYTVTWQVQPGVLPVADGFRLRARSDINTTLTVEVKEADGGSYRSWADLAAGDWKTIYLADFLPSLKTLDEDGKLDWEKVQNVTLLVYLEAPGSGLWLKELESVSLDPRRASPWLESSSQHFWVRYHASDQPAVADVIKSAEARYDQITGVMGFRPSGRVPLTLVSTHAELEQQIGGTRPTWVYGLALPDSLAMLTPLRFSPTFNGHRYDDIFKLVPHELTHLILAQIVGYPGFREVPPWLNEGLAVYLSGQGGNEQALKDSARAGNLPTLQDVDKALSGQASIGNSYDVAGSVTAYLVNKYGVDKVPLLLSALAQGADFDTALQQAAGINQATLEQQWREMLVTE